MLNFSKGKQKALVSPVDGICKSVSECSDPVFSEKTLGDGVILIPNQKEIFSPCDGTVVQVAHTFHAVCFESSDGLEILLHIGIDTVRLDGEGFKCLVKVGDTVSAGQKIMEVDFDFLKEKGYKIESPFIITNMDKLKKSNIITGDVVHGETAILEYKI